VGKELTSAPVFFYDLTTAPLRVAEAAVTVNTEYPCGWLMAFSRKDFDE